MVMPGSRRSCRFSSRQISDHSKLHPVYMKLILFMILKDWLDGNTGSDFQALAHISHISLNALKLPPARSLRFPSCQNLYVKRSDLRYSSGSCALAKICQVSQPPPPPSPPNGCVCERVGFCCTDLMCGGTQIHQNSLSGRSFSAGRSELAVCTRRLPAEMSSKTARPPGTKELRVAEVRACPWISRSDCKGRAGRSCIVVGHGSRNLSHLYEDSSEASIAGDPYAFGNCGTLSYLSFAFISYPSVGCEATWLALQRARCLSRRGMA